MKKTKKDSTYLSSFVEIGSNKTIEYTKLFQNKKPTNKVLKQTKETMVKLINETEKDQFISWGIENNKALWLLSTKVVKDDFEGKIIAGKPFWIDPKFANKEILSKLISNAMNFHKAKEKNLKLQINVLPSEFHLINLYKKVGFKVAYNFLKGDVDTSLRYLAKAKKELPSGFEIKEIDLKKDLNKMIAIDIKALKNDRSSNMYHMPENRIKNIF
ncbi:MAG: hypothetical protein HQK51_16105 [Oligoflexia bacterium]|nr:hypothetical protein [Oligoflexia bacterium]